VARPETPLPASVLKPAHAMGEEIGPLILHGFDRHELGQPRDSDAPIAPGAVLHLTFYWQLALPAEGDWLYQVWLDDRMLFDWAPVGGGYGTGQWAAGEIVRDQLDLFLPGDLTSGKYSLRMEVREPAGKNAQWPAPLGVLQVR